jgi:hypothetical protein
MYARFVTDPVIEELSFEDQRHFVFVLCLKCDGLLDKDFPDEEMRERAIARRLGLQGEAFTNAKQRLVECGLVDNDWQPRKWDELQFESDTDPTAAQRKRRQRERESHGQVTRDCHGDVTRTEQIQSRADTEQSRAESAVALIDGLDADAWTAWTVYRKQIGKPLKPASIPAAQRKLAAFGTSQAAVVDQSVANGWQGLFPLKETESAGKSRKTRYEQLYGS